MIIYFSRFLPLDRSEGIAGTVAGHPTDTIKVLQQLHGSKMSARLCIEHLIKQHGVKNGIILLYRVIPFKALMFSSQVRGLFKGMSSPLATSAVVNAIFFGVYGNTLKLLTSVSNSGQNKSPTLSQVYLAGALSGTVQLMVSCPAELAKIQLQKDISIPMWAKWKTIKHWYIEYRWYAFQK